MAHQLISRFGDGEAKRYPGDKSPEDVKEPYHESSKDHTHEVLDSSTLSHKTHCCQVEADLLFRGSKVFEE